MTHYFPPEQVENALAVMSWESSGIPTSIGDTKLEFKSNNQVYGYSVGLLQVRELPGRPNKDWLLDPDHNISYAAQIWKQQGWHPWTGARKLGIA